ncbi:Crp/Fnr family transcriptional regulator [Panacibacter ginsenosidivorans]|nr:Crp/Fnr family transcriptional regulator [Panacibacter ginsenosidivorans]
MYDLILKNIADHITLSNEERDYFISILKNKSLRRKQYLVQAGDPCRYECFITKGCLRQYYVDEAGQEHILMFAEEGWWISDMFGFVSGKVALTNVDALEDAELLLIEKTAFDKLLLQYPVFERFFRIKLQRAFISHQRRLIENMSLPADQRYCNFVERYPSFEQRLPLKQIASFLGITPESLSRIRSQRAKNS